MLGHTSRTLVTTLSVLLVLGMVTPAAAQKAKTVKRSRPTAARVNTRPAPRSTVRSAPRVSSRSAPQVKARSTPRVNTRSAPQVKTRSTPRVTTRSTPQVKARSTARVTTRSAPQVKTRSTVRVNSRVVRPTRQQPVKTGSQVKTRSTTGSQVKSRNTTARSVKSAPQSAGSTVRVNRATGTKSTAARNLSQRVARGTSSAAAVKQNSANSRVDPGDRFRERPNRGVDRDEYASSFRTRPDRRSLRHLDYRYRYPNSRRYYRPGYWDGYYYGYTRGYIYGYHLGFRRGFYRYSHYYGPHLVLGYHYGGFAFYSGYWHFALVIGDPYWHHHHHYYHYTWWDGRPAALVTWDEAVEAYPADYAFAPGACVELWLRTRDGVDYALRIDPRFWNARDPGELYAALWIELEQTGGLEIQDVNGVVHFFEAGQIQQIEARPCR